MSDIFDDDLVYIQAGGILGVSDIRKMWGSWNAYLDSLKLPLRKISQQMVDVDVPANFHWRRIVRKSAAGVDEVAVEFISKNIPGFKYTTDPIKTKSKRQRALRLAMPSRQQERRATGLQYLRHLKMTQPMFLRTPPRDIATHATQAVFTAVYGEAEMGRRVPDDPQTQLPRTHLSVAPRQLQVQLLGEPQAYAEPELTLGMHPQDVLARQEELEKQREDDEGFFFDEIPVGTITQTTSKDPRFLDQTYHFIVGKEEFGGDFFNTPEEAQAHKEKVLSMGVPEGEPTGFYDTKRSHILEEAENLREATRKDRVYWSHRASYPSRYRTKSYPDSERKVKEIDVAPFMATGGMVGMLLQHSGRFTDGALQHQDQADPLEWDNNGEIFSYPENITKKWDIARWVAEFLYMDYSRKMEYFKYYERVMWINYYGHTYEQDKFNEEMWDLPIYSYEHFLTREDEHTEEEDLNKEILSAIEDIFGQIGTKGKAVKGARYRILRDKKKNIADMNIKRGTRLGTKNPLLD